MKILHTSDWHLGRSLYGRKRYREYAAFLDWLLDTIKEQGVEVLLVAGDIFDTSTPTNRAQELYYRFLCRVAASCCRHVLIIGGNHDSPSFLNAPKRLLKTLNILVVGAKANREEEEVFILYSKEQIAQAIVCAVPYLRDKDIRIAAAGESIDDKNTKLVQGVREHYQKVCSYALAEREALRMAGAASLPILAMGHLFTANGKTVEGDGVRELYVGSLAHIDCDVFPASLDYVALGHLHMAQLVGQKEHIRYCGAPIPMGFGERDQEKKVVLVEFASDRRSIHELTIPCFQELIRIAGGLDEILARIERLKMTKSRAWLEIEYTGQETVYNLQETLEEALAGSVMEIRRVQNRRIMEGLLAGGTEEEMLDDLDPGDVFSRCLDAYEIADEDRLELTASYREIIQELQEEDLNAQ